MYVFCADFVWVSYWYMYEFRADFMWKSYSNLVWKVVAKSHTFPINFPHLQLVHFPYESRTSLFTGLSAIFLSKIKGWILLRADSVILTLCGCCCIDDKEQSQETLVFRYGSVVPNNGSSSFKENIFF